METIQLLSVALGLAALAGINLYLTVFVTGLAIRMEWITLASQYQQLEILAHPAILIISGTLYFLEFFADKVPWVDSLWDSAHTIIRPIGGTLLAIQVLGKSDPVFDVAVAILAGGMALTTHSVKAGTRLIVNSSPEPFSNIGISVAEDVGVLAGLWMLHVNPALSLIVLILFIATALYFAPAILRGIRLKLWLMWHKLNGPASDSARAPLPTRLPSEADILFSRLNKDHKTIAWTVPCHAGKLPGAPTGVSGHLVALNEEAPNLYFVAPRRFGSISTALNLEGWKVSHEPAFLSENLVLYSVTTRKRILFLFERSRVDAVKHVAADLEDRVGPVTQQQPLDALKPAESI